jgi:hypothetical protein
VTAAKAAKAAKAARATAKPARLLSKPPHVLDPVKVHAWRIERQLLGRSKAASPVEVARMLVGVQAQVTSSAALAIALRTKAPAGKTPATEATARALRDRRLVRSWAMRGTLHLLAAEDVPTIAAALGGKDNWRRPAWLRWFGVTEPEMDALIDAIGDVLDDGRPRTRAEMAEEIGTRLGAKQGRLLLGSWGSALKVASDRHYLVQSADDAAGSRFVRASRWIDSWRDEDEHEALATVVQRYLAAYGPATLKETLRWWGVSVVAVVKPLFGALGDALTEVEVDGARAFVRTEDVDTIRAIRPRRESVQLVGGFDPFIVGAGLREQLIPPKHLKRVSRTAGWISPVVLVDGRAAGVWDWTRTSKGLAITVEPFGTAGAGMRAAIEMAAEKVGEAQGLAVTVRYGRVFAEKGRKLMIEPENA